MSVIQLDFIQLSKSGKLVTVMVLFVVADDIIEGCRAEEILLLQTELLTGISRIVGVQNTGNVFGILSFRDGTMIVTGIKLIKIKCVASA